MIAALSRRLPLQPSFQRAAWRRIPLPKRIAFHGSRSGSHGMLPSGIHNFLMIIENDHHLLEKGWVFQRLPIKPNNFGIRSPGGPVLLKYFDFWGTGKPLPPGETLSIPWLPRQVIEKGLQFAVGLNTTPQIMSLYLIGDATMGFSLGKHLIEPLVTGIPRFEISGENYLEYRFPLFSGESILAEFFQDMMEFQTNLCREFQKRMP